MLLLLFRQMTNDACRLGKHMNVEIDNCRWRCHKLASTNNLNNCSLLASASCHQQLCRTSHSISCFGLYVLYSVKRFFFLFLNQNLYEKKKLERPCPINSYHGIPTYMRHKMINIYWHVPLSSEIQKRRKINFSVANFRRDRSAAAASTLLFLFMFWQLFDSL